MNYSCSNHLYIQGSSILYIQGSSILYIPGSFILYIQGSSILFIQGSSILYIQGSSILYIQGSSILYIQGSSNLYIQGSSILYLQGSSIIMLCLGSKEHMSLVKRICVFEHSVMTNFNCACPAIQRGQGSGFLSEGSSWFTACMSEQRRFWRDCADAQARLNLRCSHRR